MKSIHLLFCLLLFLTANMQACKKGNVPDNEEKEPGLPEEIYDLKTSDLHIRDPFIFIDTNKQCYYLHASKGNKIVAYKTKDLLRWKLLGNSFVPAGDFWGKQDFWAPDLYEYESKYYMFVTFSSLSRKRGTSILVAEDPEGPFKPLINDAVTPANWMCLDGTLFIDSNNQPWIIYCHEWLEAGDGEVVAQKLSEDLKNVSGDPVVLFHASEAPWVGSISSGSITGNVTDAPFIYKLNNGELVMLWSSFTKDGRYAIGFAHSRSGSILGPWEQKAEPLNNDNGGHAMLFKDMKGRLMISYHSPNRNTERPVIKQVYINNGELILPSN